MLSVDLNSDLGEGFLELIAAVTMTPCFSIVRQPSGCGLHAGDPEVMARTLPSPASARRGRCPSRVPGSVGFGRRRLPFSNGEIERLVAYQIGAATALAATRAIASPM